MDKNTAARAIRKLAIQFEAMKDAADLLDSIHSYEQAVEETKARIEAARADEKTVLAQLAAAREKLKACETQAAAAVANADAKAVALHAETKATAEKVIETAKSMAADLVGDARQRASEADNRARHGLAAIEVERKAGADALAEVCADLASKSAELAAVKAKIEQAKAAMRQFVSG